MYKNIDIQLKSSNSIYILLVFLLSPLLAVYISVLNYKETWAKNSVFLFSGFFGYTFVIGNTGSDINRYKNLFEMHCKMHLGVKDFIKTLIDKNNLDFIQPLLSYLASSFTENFQVFLMIIGLFFGFFLSRNIWNVLSLASKKPIWYGLLFVIVFSFLFAVWDINVMRFSLASQIFFYGIFNKMIYKKKWGLLFVFISPFIHFSFFIAIGVYLIYILLGNLTKLYFVCFLVSLTISFNLDVFENQLSFLPQTYIEKSEDYINEDYQELKVKMTENKNFRGKFYQSSLKWAVGILLVFLYLNRKKIKEKNIENLFAFTLLFIAVFNLLSVIPSMNRFQFIGYMLAFALFYPCLKGELKHEKKIILICAPLILFYFIIKFRIGLEFTGLYTLFGGPIFAMFSDGDIALIEFFK
ncbi:MAG: EpsG family protein [Flavobacterium sp.]|nr:EpsG family protein [Flavobacterium sp.]